MTATMKEFDNLIVNDARGRKVYAAGRKAYTPNGSDLTALQVWLKRNSRSEAYTMDDDESFLAGYEYEASLSTPVATLTVAIGPNVPILVGSPLVVEG